MRNYLFFALLLGIALPVSANKVAIIGGGMAGVAAAAFLKDGDHQVHLIEAKEKLGGNAQTVWVENNRGQLVAVDAGPQYFAKGAWDLYIDFLKHFGQLEPANFIEFDTSVVIAQKNVDWPILATPRMRLSHIAINLCHNNSFRLAALKELLDASRKLYKSANPDKDLSVEDWLNQICESDDHKAQVFLPFLASILGTSIAQTKQLSALSLAHLYAFRAPSVSEGSKFLVSVAGMGEIIKRISATLSRNKNIQIRTASPVRRIEKTAEGYLVQIADQDAEFFDTVIVATHPAEMAQMINYRDLVQKLSSLPYVSARIVIHRDGGPDFINPGYPAHFNIMIGDNNEVMTTMNLAEISDSRFNGLFKSWVNSDDIFYKIKGVQKTIEFQHPLMTPFFLQTVSSIQNDLADNVYGLGSGFAIAGGWTEVHETQNTAILSAYKAVTRLGLLSDREKRIWNKRLNIEQHL